MAESKQYFKLLMEHLLDSNLKDSSEILVLCILTHLSEKTGYSWISNDKLAQFTRLKKRQVQNILASLRDKGYINVIHPTKRSRQIYINEMDSEGIPIDMNSVFDDFTF